jgi:hypothetical protein
MLDVRLVHVFLYERCEQGTPCCGDTGGRWWSKKTVRLSDQIRNEFQSLAQGMASSYSCDFEEPKSVAAQIHVNCVQFYASSENVSLLPLVVRLNSIKPAS